MSENLLPCPFCGGVPTEDYGDMGGLVECAARDCPVNPSVWMDSEPNEAGIIKAIRQWNTRAKSTIAENALARMTTERDQDVERMQQATAIINQQTTELAALKASTGASAEELQKAFKSVVTDLMNTYDGVKNGTAIISIGQWARLERAQALAGQLGST